MSTNKTENYHLHAWELEDHFLLSEINENFAALDRAAWIVAGVYTGNGWDSREIDLGFAPIAVLVFSRSGKTAVSSGQDFVYGGLALPDNPVYASPGGTAIELTERGFQLRNGSYTPVNSKGSTYHYLALR